MSEIKSFIYAVSTLAGTIIGVGIFSLPYITLQVGFDKILLYFLILGAMVIILHLFFGELSLKTADYKRFPGFVKIYLGENAKKIAYFSTIVGTFGALLAYLIVGGDFLKEIFFPIFGGKEWFYTLFYFLIGASFIFFGIKIIAQVEFLGLIGFLTILFWIFFQEREMINFNNLFLRNSFSFSSFFLPYGPILFSIWGASLVPEIEEMLREKKHFLKSVIVTSILISILIYLFFIYLILGISGSETTPSALTGLKLFLNDEIFSLVIFFGILTTFTSFISLGLMLKNVFFYDLKMKEKTAFLIVVSLPIIFYFLGFKDFIPVISFVGGVTLGIDGILILLMYRKEIKNQKLKIKNFLIYPLIFILLGGIVYEIFYFVK